MKEKNVLFPFFHSFREMKNFSYEKLLFSKINDIFDTEGQLYHRFIRYGTVNWSLQYKAIQSSQMASILKKRCKKSAIEIALLHGYPIMKLVILVVKKKANIKGFFRVI